MAFYLVLDGINDHVTLATDIVLPSTGDIEIRYIIRHDASAPFLNLWGNRSNNNSIFRPWNRDNEALVKPASGTTHLLSYITPLVQGVFYDRILKRTAGVWDIVETDTGLTVVTAPSAVDNSEMRIEQLFRRRSQEYFSGAIKRLQITVAGLLTHDFDPSASLGAGSVLPDTVGSNDGTLVGFPTDDSQWVFYADVTGLTLTSINPTSGPSTGGTTVTMTGTGFEAGTVPKFNGVDATSVVIVSDTELTCVTPPFYSITGPGQFLSPTGSDFFITSEGKAFVVGISFSPLGSDLLITSDGDMFIV